MNNYRKINSLLTEAQVMIKMVLKVAPVMAFVLFAHQIHAQVLLNDDSAVADEGFAEHKAMSDRVLVIINEDVITQTEFAARRKSVVAELQASQRPIPAGLDKQLLDSMVSDRLQIQEAQRRGIDVSDQELQDAIGRLIAQQNITLEQLQLSLEETGQSYEGFAETVRESLIISRFSEFYARSRVTVPEYEIASQMDLQPDDSEYEIAQILLIGKDKAEIAAQVRDEIARGLSFQQAVLTYSEALDAQQGGSIGRRQAKDLPEFFLAAVKDMKVGTVSDVIEGPTGFHILKLIDYQGDRTEILQTKIRHILISAESSIAKSQAKKKALKLRERIVQGEDFETLARIFSDDSGSAARGGELGWVSPGETVPPFEQAFTPLAIGEISQPVESQFGVHILRVEDRRQKNVTDQIKRNRAENFLRRQRADREFGQWVRELMEGAYIEHVAEPS